MDGDFEILLDGGLVCLLPREGVLLMLIWDSLLLFTEECVFPLIAYPPIHEAVYGKLNIKRDTISSSIVQRL